MKRNKAKQSEKKNIEAKNEAKRKIRKRNKAKRQFWEAKRSEIIDAKFSLEHAKRKRNESRFALVSFEAKKN
jgi:hypothetical protein